MRGQKGFWRRPASRTYAYNLNVGEHYYSPMTSYLDAERGSREKRVHKQRAELREGEAHTQSTIWTFYGWRLWLTTNGPALMSLFPSGKHVKISILSPEGKSNPRNKITRFFLKSVCLTRLCIWPFNRQVESVKNPIQKYEILCSVIVIIVLCCQSVAPNGSMLKKVFAWDFIWHSNLLYFCEFRARGEQPGKILKTLTGQKCDFLVGQLHPKNVDRKIARLAGSHFWSALICDPDYLTPS
jgi:hypothetical protein